MKKAVNWLCVAAFALCCALVWLFFAPLMETGGTLPVLDWETAELVEGGASESFDMYSERPETGPDGYYRFTLELPVREELMYIVLNGVAGECALYLDGAELYSGRTSDYSAMMRFDLEPGGGELLTLECRPESAEGVFPPMIQITDDPDSERETIGYANYYAIPAGAMAIVFVLLTGFFLLGIAGGRANWRLALIIFASAELSAGPLITGFGTRFFPVWASDVFNQPLLETLCLIAVAAYLALHRSRRFWRTWGLITAASAGALLLACGVSALAGGPLASNAAMLVSQAASGYYRNLVYWLTFYLVLVCALLSAWEIASAFAAARAEKSALELKNRLVMENYRSVESKLRKDAELRHEFAHLLTVIDAYAKAGDCAALERCISGWREDSDASQARFTEHIAVNAMLQDAAGRARADGAAFSASVMMPREPGIPDEDLCRLIMNMLDNACEGAARTPPGKARFVRVQIRDSGGFLAVSCANSFDGNVTTDARGEPLSTKDEPEAHGFGLAQMRAVAEKYSSVLDISWTGSVFKVQTALKLRAE